MHNKKLTTMFTLSIVAAIFFTLLFSCEVAPEQEVEIKSTMTRDSLDKLNSSVGVDWQVKSVTNMTISKRTGGTPDSLDIADPCIIKMGENDYRMWYSGSGPNGIGVGLWRICYATSSDGETWNKDYVNNAVLVPNEGAEAKDKDGVRVLAVIYDSDEKLYKMWYRGFNGSKINIFYAFSKYPNKGWIKFPNDEFVPDGNPEPVITIDPLYTGDQDFTGSGAVIKEVNYITPEMKKNIYSMWYVVKGSDGYRVMYRYSFDGMKWFSDLGVLPVFSALEGFYINGTVMPTVIKDYYEDQPVYKMWFIGLEEAGSKYKKQIGLAYCFNYGVKFVYFDQSGTVPPIIAPGEFEQDKGGISGINVIRDGNRYKMWYMGRSETDVPTLCYRESIGY